MGVTHSIHGRNDEYILYRVLITYFLRSRAKTWEEEIFLRI
jgi:hypothetical protein